MLSHKGNTMHTPGPWHVTSGNFVRPSYGGLIATVPDRQDGSNAAIIAAAPELLAALEKMVADASVPWPEGAGAWAADKQEEFASAHFASVLAEAKAAIAKAKGETT